MWRLSCVLADLISRDWQTNVVSTPEHLSCKLNHSLINRIKIRKNAREKKNIHELHKLCVLLRICILLANSIHMGYVKLHNIHDRTYIHTS